MIDEFLSGFGCLSISTCFRVIIDPTPALSALSLAFCSTSWSMSRHCM